LVASLVAPARAIVRGATPVFLDGQPLSNLDAVRCAVRTRADIVVGCQSLAFDEPR